MNQKPGAEGHDTDFVMNRMQGWATLAFKVVAVIGGILAFLLANEKRLATMENHILNLDYLIQKQDARMDKMESAVDVGMRNQDEIIMLLKEQRKVP